MVLLVVVLLLLLMVMNGERRMASGPLGGGLWDGDVGVVGGGGKLMVSGLLCRDFRVLVLVCMIVERR